MRRAFLLLVAGGCSSGERMNVAAHAIDTLPGGIVRVVNHAPSEWRDTSGWRFVLARRITPVEGADGLGNPSAIAALREWILVLEEAPVSIAVYDTGGRFVRRIGRDGAGPGEFRGRGMLLVVGDTIVHHDPQQARTTLFRLNGTVVRQWISVCCYQQPVRVDSAGRLPLSAQVRRDVPQGDEQGFIRFTSTGAVLDTIHPPMRENPPLWVYEDQGRQARQWIPFTPGRAGTLTAQGTYVWGDTEHYRFIVSRTGSDTVRLIEAHAAAVPIADSTREQRLAALVKRSPALAPVARLADIPTTYPLWREVQDDAADNLWVLRPGPDGLGAVWDVFDAAGVLRGSVPSPFTSTWRTWWGTDQVLRIGESKAGEPVIEQWRIVRR